MAKIKRIKGKKRRNSVLARLASRHGWICWYCGVDVSATSAIRPRIEHIVPASDKSGVGTNSESNFALACEFCDRAKWITPLPQFLAWLHRPKTSIFTIPNQKGN